MWTVHGDCIVLDQALFVEYVIIIIETKARTDF